MKEGRHESAITRKNITEKAQWTLFKNYLLAKETDEQHVIEIRQSCQLH